MQNNRRSTLSRACVLLVLVLCIASCVETQNTTPVDRPPHHLASGFTNPHIRDPDKSFWSFLRMRWFGDDLWADHPATADQVPFQRVSVERLHNPGQAPQITWLGHSTFLIQYRGFNVLTDPMLSDRASPVSFAGPKRYVPHTMDYAQLPAIDLIVISHNHYDHLDTTSIEQLRDTRGFAVPLGLGDWLQDRGIPASRIHELDWWQTASHDQLKIMATPSQHWSARGLGDRFDTLWASWSVRIADFHLWFAGDTGYNSIQFKDIGRALEPVDLALIPIGAYQPRWFMQYYHVNPAEALQIHQDIKAKRSIGMHWGTFPLTAEAPLTPRNELAAQLATLPDDIDFTTMALGETRAIEIPTAHHQINSH